MTYPDIARRRGSLAAILTTLVFGAVGCDDGETPQAASPGAGGTSSVGGAGQGGKAAQGGSAGAVGKGGSAQSGGASGKGGAGGGGAGQGGKAQGGQGQQQGGAGQSQGGAGQSQGGAGQSQGGAGQSQGGGGQQQGGGGQQQGGAGQSQGGQQQGGAGQSQGGGGQGQGGQQAGGQSGGIDIENPPPASQIGALVASKTVVDVLPAGDRPWAFGLFADNGVALLDFTDPSQPKEMVTLPTGGKVVSVDFDEASRWAYTLDASGQLQVHSLLVPSAPKALQSAAVGGGAPKGMARVGRRVFVLSGTQVLPFVVGKGADGSATLTAEAAIDAGDATAIASGGDRLYVANAAGALTVWGVATDGQVSQLGAGSLGGDFVGLVGRGSYVLSVVKNQGLIVLDTADPAALKVVYQDKVLTDPRTVRVFGRLLVITLDRQYVSSIDLSDFKAPRVITTNKGLLPGWVAAIDGNLIHGEGTDAKVLGIPPFVAGKLPGKVAGSFPRVGRIPLTMSKPIDPASAGSIKVLCNGAEVQGSITVSIDRRVLTFLPSAPLPPSASCTVDLSGIADPSGTAPQAGGAVGFTTSSQEPGPIDIPKSAYPHTADGGFTDFSGQAGGQFEYFDVTGAQGMYSSFYADYDGTRLWLLNDWYFNSEAIDPDCYNQFQVWTGGGADRWEIKSYGDQRIEVMKNGTKLDIASDEVLGGYKKGKSPNSDEEHTMFELGIKTAPGTWGVQLHDPGPVFVCTTLQNDPTSYQGGTTQGGGASLDPTGGVGVPLTPGGMVPGDGAVDVDLMPTLTWEWLDGASVPVAWWFELSTGAGFGSPFYGIYVYGPRISLPPGLLSPGSTYSWRVTAWNAAGTRISQVQSFTTKAPTSTCPHSECQVGDRMSDCSSCALAVVGQRSECGNIAWDGACVQLATTLKECQGFCQGGAGGAGGASGAGGSGAGGNPGATGPVCASQNDGFGTNGAVTGTKTLAFKHVATDNLTVTGVSVFTDYASPGENRLAIYADDTQPSIALAEGFFTPVDPEQMQGVTLDKPVQLQAGGTYWVVWTPRSGQLASLGAGGTSGQYRGSDDLQIWDGPYNGFPIYALHCGDTGAGGAAGAGGAGGAAGAGGQSGGGSGGQSGGGSGGAAGAGGAGGAPTCAGGRFVILDSGSPGLVLDTTTGLTWLRSMGTTLYDYPVAVSHCDALGMRLPTKDELLAVQPADLCAWPDVWQTWTTTPGAAAGTQVWGNSLGSVKDQLTTNSRGALCVRSQGLVLDLDASNPASFSGQGNSWVDLAQGHTVTLPGGYVATPEYGGGIMVSMAPITVSAAPYWSMSPASAGNTIEMWWRKGSITGHGGQVIGTYPANGGTWQIFQNAEGYAPEPKALLLYANGNAPQYHWSGSTLELDEVVHTVVVQQQRSFDLYKNGVYVSTQQRDSFDESGSRVMALGCNTSSTECGPKTFYTVRWYDRSLSAAEIAQNFEATRAKYGK